MQKLTFLFLNLFLGFTASSQTWEIGLFGGGAVYNGTIDVTLGTALPQTRPAFGLFGDYHFTDAWSLRTQLTFAQLYADEKKFGSSTYRQSLGRSFQTSISELSLTPELTLFRLDNLTFYAFGGVAIARFTPVTDFNESLYNEGSAYMGLINGDKMYQKTQATVAIPIGGGIKWVMNEKYALGAELGGRKTFSSYIDGISLAGYSKSKDYYFFGGLTFSILFDSERMNGGRHSRYGSQNGVSCPHF